MEACWKTEKGISENDFCDTWQRTLIFVEKALGFLYHSSLLNEVYIAMKVQSEEVRVMKPCSLECGCLSFRETHCLGFQGNDVQYHSFPHTNKSKVWGTMQICIMHNMVHEHMIFVKMKTEYTWFLLYTGA
jgi:hypothetical protein